VLLPTYFGIAAPAGTPAAVVKRLSDEMHKALTAPDVVERLKGAGLDAHGGSPDEMAQTVRKDVAHVGALLQANGIQPE
jgi:tripartite-type tricarboxylate transporter receptor subunit TctC